MNIPRITRGHLGRLWTDDYKLFPYVKQPITDGEIKTWESQGYDYVKSFSGSMYDNRNPMPEWIDTIEHAFGMYNQTYTFYRMDTLEIMPVHSDHFSTYSRLFNVPPEKVHRVVLMLEDWKPGHYFELDGVGYVNWKAGDWFMWSGDTPHAASNIGIEPRYTLQVTGTSIAEGQLNKLFFHNIPGKESTCSHPFMKNKVLPKIPEQHVMVYMSNDYITELEEIVHSEDDANILNKNGLDFYLFEPLNSYDATSDIKFNQEFYSEFSHDINPDYLRADELDSIYKYAIRNNLTNVTVHTCDYDVKRWYPYYSDRLNLICDDLFLKTQVLISNLDETYRSHFSRRFSCLNWRFTNHRQLAATFLAGDDAYISWYHKSSFENLNNDLFFDLESWKEKHFKHYCRLKVNAELVLANSPYIIDVPANHDTPAPTKQWPNVHGYGPGETPSLKNIESNALSWVYTTAFVDVVTETRFAQPTGNFSEKVLQPIQYQKPFILLAPPKTLDYLKSFGYKTFNDFWDESYDDIYDHSERLAKIFDILEYIANLSQEECSDIYERMRPIVQHNLKTFKELVKK